MLQMIEGGARGRVTKVKIKQLINVAICINAMKTSTSIVDTGKINFAIAIYFHLLPIYRFFKRSLRTLNGT